MTHNPSTPSADPAQCELQRARASRMNAEAEGLLSSDPPRARKIARSARELASRYGIRETQPFSRFIEGTAISFATDFDSACRVLEEAAAEARALGQGELANRCDNGLATIYERMGEYGKSCEMLHNCLSVAIASHDVKARIRALSNLAMLHVNMADYDRAVALLQEAASYVEGIVDPHLVLSVSANLADALVCGGRFSEGLDIGRRCQVDAAAGGLRLAWGFITATVAAAMMGIGQLEAAAQEVAAARAVAKDLGERDLLCDLLLKEAEIAQAGGPAMSAETTLDEALALAEEIRIRVFEARAHRLKAEAYARRGDYRLAFEHRTRELVVNNELKDQTTSRKVQVLAVEMVVNQHRRRAEEEQQRSGELAALNQRLTETLERAEHYASHDSLTELLNRRKFLDLTEDALARAEAKGELLGLAFVDLDGFKQINDTYGHDVGDALLMQVAKRLKLAVRGCDLVARAGGDEFMVLLRELTSTAQIGVAVARLGKIFDDPFILQGEPMAFGGSVGHAVFPHDGDTVTALRVAADRAMYAEKRRRRAA